MSESPEQPKSGEWDSKVYPYPEHPECEQEAICPVCKGRTVIRNGWLFCLECNYAELLNPS